MARRIPRSPASTPDRPRVRFEFDGREVEAYEGEPIATALVAEGLWALARSPKFHRPRGPSCLRGACDGCLARVSGEPNVMTCLTPVRSGIEVVSQNTFGARDLDLLRVTDWFFPDGMNHHELFAGVPGVQGIMQAFARRVAGLGKMPEATAPAQTAQRREVDVLVVGAGASGAIVATMLAKRGLTVEVVDDATAIGGSARATFGEAARAFEPAIRALEEDAATGKVRVRLRTVAGAVFGRDVLVVAGDEGAEVIQPRALVLAPGAHDGVLLFEGNDVPGVLSARAAGLLLRSNVLVGDHVVVAGRGSLSLLAESVANEASRLGASVERVTTDVVRVKGSASVKGVVVRRKNGKEETLKADVLVVDAPPSPSYELATQAGASLRHEPRGFVVVADENGVICEGTWATGEAAGVPFEPAAIAAHAERVAASIAARLS